jgi:hypothetical protein
VLCCSLRYRPGNAPCAPLPSRHTLLAWPYKADCPPLLTAPCATVPVVPTLCSATSRNTLLAWPYKAGCCASVTVAPLALPSR